MHGNGGGNRFRGGAHQLRERIFSLLAVEEAHGLAEFFGGEVLEAIEVLDGARVVTLAAIGLGEAEFGGDLKRIQLQRIFESCDGFFILLLLRIHEAEEILRVGVAGVESCGFLEMFDGGFGLAGSFGEEAEVEPDARILRVALGGFLEDLLGVVEALHVEESYANVDSADVSFLVEDAGALKFAEGFFEVLAVHEGDAVIIFADDFGAWGLLLFGGGGFRDAAADVGARGLRRFLLGLLWGLLLLTEAGKREGDDGEGNAQIGPPSYKVASSPQFHEIHISRERVGREMRNAGREAGAKRNTGLGAGAETMEKCSVLGRKTPARGRRYKDPAVRNTG